ncbi:MAG: DUF11 domain-containing protein, partial [Flammeovirgaceae bacterium]
NADTSVKITDVLPADVELVSVTHEWNLVAITNDTNLPTGVVTLADTNQTNSNVTLSQNSFGQTEVEIRVSQGLRGGDLGSLEGGEIHFLVKSKASLVTGTRLDNKVYGCYANPIANYCINQSDPVWIQNPDLKVQKNVNITNPLAGQEVLYTLNISNLGPNKATEVGLKDTLPQGLCFVGGTASLDSDWTIGQPTVTFENTDCTSGKTFLTWSVADNNTLKYKTNPLGYFPPCVLGSICPGFNLQYKVLVNSGLSQGTVLTNKVEVITPNSRN